MVSFVVKGWVTCPLRLSLMIGTTCASYQCSIEVSLDNKKLHLLQGNMKYLWLPVFDKMETHPNSVLMIRITGDGERELAAKIIDILMYYEIANNRFMILFPNRGLREAVDDDGNAAFSGEAHAQAYEQDLMRLVCPEEPYPCSCYEEY